VVKIHPKDVGLPFARTIKTKKRMPKIIEKEREHIQPAVDKYLAVMKNLHHFEVIRIPDVVYAAIKYHPHLPEWAKKKAIAALRRIPDNILIKRHGLVENKALCLELKTEGYDLSQGQQKFAKNVNVQVRKSFRSAREEIDHFIKE
jgi:hypothetical protein